MAQTVLTQMRRAVGLSQEQLAEAAGLGVRTIREIERGMVPRPRLDTVRRLADALGLSGETRTRFEAHYRGERTIGITVGAPRQLPHDVPSFVGRTAELAALDQLLGVDRHDTSATIAVLVGAGGVGKSGLATHWAHRHREHFPDGQLWIDLRGFDTRQPVSPDDALDRFLRALGADGSQIPAELDGREMLYRSLVDQRRLLVVLDNARDGEQVRSLLPGSPSCLVIVTSRQSMAGLVARHGARRVEVAPLPEADAVALLQKLIGDRTADEPDAAATIARHCAQLPLALRIAAELAVTGANRPLGDLATDLGDSRRRLDLLAAGDDPHTAVRSVFAWSYEQLVAKAATMFRRLGLHPGATFDAYAAAALAGLDLQHGERTLDALTRAHLIDRTAVDRYALHDLLRVWAAERCEAEDSPSQRRHALGRLCDHYRSTAHAAMTVFSPGERERLPKVPETAIPLPDLPDGAAATAWLDAEVTNLLAVTELAADNNLADVTVDLALIPFRYLNARAYDQEAVRLYTLASRLAVGAPKARSLNNLGITQWHLGRITEAVDVYEQALAIAQEEGDRATEGGILGNLGVILRSSGQPGIAVEHLRQAITIAQEAGNRDGEIRSHANLGTTYITLGRYDDALASYQRVQQLATQSHDESAYRLAEGNIGETYSRLGQLDRALRHLERYLELSREQVSRVGEANALNQLGVVYASLGELERAQDLHQHALTVARELGRHKPEVEILNDLGRALLRSGHLEAAIECHEDAMALATDAGYGYELARAHDGLGHAHERLGDADLARRHWRSALDRYEAMGVPEAETLRERLGQG